MMLVSFSGYNHESHSVGNCTVYQFKSSVCREHHNMFFCSVIYETWLATFKGYKMTTRVT